MPRTHSGQRGRVSVQSRPWRFSAPTRDKISPSLQRPQKGEHQRYCTRLLAAAARQACYGLVCCLLCFAWLVLVVSWVRTFPFLSFICHHFLSFPSVLYIYPHRFVPLQYLRLDGLRHCQRRCPDILHARLLVCSRNIAKSARNPTLQIVCPANLSRALLSNENANYWSYCRMDKSDDRH